MGRTKEMMPEPDEYDSQDDYGYEPDELDMLRAEKDRTFNLLLALINTAASEEEKEAARKGMLAARDACWDAEARETRERNA